MPLSDLAAFKISHLAIVEEGGGADGRLDPDWPEAELWRAYAAMRYARAADERLLTLQREGRIGHLPLATGTEATACGLALALFDADWYAGYYRDLGVRLTRGIGLDAILRYWGGGLALPMGDQPAGRNLPLTPLGGAQALHAVGVALSLRRRGDEGAVVVLLGDGALGRGEAHEAMTLAGARKLPVVFVCLNNQWAGSIRRAHHCGAETLAQRAIGYGIEGLQVNGDDLLAVWRGTSAALSRAREGGGAALIEAVSCRLGMDTSSDDPARYRDRHEVANAWRGEPIARFRAYLQGRGLWDPERARMLEGEIATEIDAAVARGLSSSTASSSLGGLSRAEERAPGVEMASASSGRTATTEPPAPGDGGVPRGAHGARLDPTLSERITDTLAEAMHRDGALVVLGQGIGDTTGARAAGGRLREAFGEDRVMDLALSEPALIGVAYGMALAGDRPVLELRSATALLSALGQIQAAFTHAGGGGEGGRGPSMVVRVPYGDGPHPTQRGGGDLALALGALDAARVILPSQVTDPAPLFRQALSASAPVFLLEPNVEQRIPMTALRGDPPSSPVPSVSMVQSGRDATIVSWGPCMGVVLRGVRRLEEEQGGSVEVLTVHMLHPLDAAEVVASVRRTGRLAIVSDAAGRGGTSAEIVAQVNDGAAAFLEAPIVRLALPDVLWAPTGRGGGRVPVGGGAADEEVVVTALSELLDY